MIELGDLSNLSLEELRKLKRELEVEYQKHDLTQMTMKVALNSLYGCMGNQHFIFYRTEMAEAITLSGQYVIRKVADDMNDWIQNMTGTSKDIRIGGDTDSVFLNFSPIVDKYMPDATEEEKLNKIVEFSDTVADKKIKEILAEACENMNAFDSSALDMEREAVCDAGCFVAKKKYTLSIVDKEKERLVKPEHKVTGLDSKRTEYSQYVRNKLKEAYWIILHKEEKDLISFVDEFKKEFLGMDIEAISQVTAVNNIEKYTKVNLKGAGPNVKGAVAHNQYIEKKGIQKWINPVVSGSKIRYVHLRIPNPTLSEVFAYEGEWKPQYELDEYVDRYKQFEKSFESPLRNLTDYIDYNIKQDTYDIF